MAIELIDKAFDDPAHMFGGHQLIQRHREQGRLAPIFTAYKSHKQQCPQLALRALSQSMPLTSGFLHRLLARGFYCLEHAAIRRPGSDTGIPGRSPSSSHCNAVPTRCIHPPQACRPHCIPFVRCLNARSRPCRRKRRGFPKTARRSDGPRPAANRTRRRSDGRDISALRIRYRLRRRPSDSR